MNLATFRTTYPELKNASDGSVNNALSGASALVSSSAFGDAYDLAHGLMAAHLLSVAPGGQGARKDPKRPAPTGWKATTYGEQYEQIRNARTALKRSFP